MKLYAIIKSNNNRILNKYTNHLLLLKDIITYESPNTQYTCILSYNNSLIHLDLDRILQKNNFLNLTIGELITIISKDIYLKTYKCTGDHPNVIKNLCNFNIGDVLENTDILFSDPTNKIFTYSINDNLASDLAINIKTRDNTKLIPIFDNKIYWNKGTTSHVIMENLKETIINKFFGKVPLEKISFIDLTPFEDSVIMKNLNNYDVNIINNNDGIPVKIIISNVKSRTLELSIIKSVILVINGKLLPFSSYQYNVLEDNIIIDINILQQLDTFKSIVDDITNINSFLILSKYKMYYEYLSNINDVLLYNSKIYSVNEIKYNSIFILDTRNYTIVPHTVLPSKLQDVNMSIVFDEIYEDFQKVSPKTIEQYHDNIKRYELMINSYETKEDILTPLYEDSNIYKLKSVNLVDRINYLIPFRILYGN